MHVSVPPVQHIERIMRAGGCLAGGHTSVTGLLAAQARGPGFDS